MKLLSPIKNGVITQDFGVNGAWYQAHGINIKGHNGLDFFAYHGMPIYASHDGFAYYEWDSAQGEGVVIRSKEPMMIDGKLTAFKTVYWHFVDAQKEPLYKSPIKCYDINSQGQEVKAGDLIGYADNTGLSQGDHLHFALKPISEGESLGAMYNLNQNNGYLGCIDPTPYLSPLTPQVMFNKDLYYGMRDNDVIQLQIRLGMPMKYQTGYFGLLTKAAVAKYQLSHGIYPPFGYVGKLTRASLNK